MGNRASRLSEADRRRGLGTLPSSENYSIALLEAVLDEYHSKAVLELNTLPAYRNAFRHI